HRRQRECRRTPTHAPRGQAPTQARRLRTRQCGGHRRVLDSHRRRLNMPRHPLRRGEATPTRLDVREPGGKWVALSSKPSGYRAPRGTTWRARARIRIGASAQPVRVSAEGETRVAAERLLGQRLDQYRLDDGRTTATTDTVGERVAAYMEDVEAGDVPAVRAERSRTTYRSIAKNHVTGGKIAGVRVTELTPADLNREAQRLHKKGAT